MSFDVIIHTPNLSSSINLVTAKNEFNWQPCQSDLVLILKCVIISKWVPNLAWQAYYNKLLKISFLYTFCRPNEESVQIWCFTSTYTFYNIFTNSFSIWEIFDW